MTSLSPDTQAVLLLCGHFGEKSKSPVAPLSHREYGELAQWLRSRELHPSNLLETKGTRELHDLVQIKLDPARVRQLLGRGAALALAAEKWIRSGLWVISRGDEGYPKRLKKMLGHNAPATLFVAGELSLLDVGGLAIVGSRNADDESLEFTRRIARACARAKVAVVSGGAKGADSAAMQSAGDSDGVVIGVLADGLLRASVNRQNRQGIENERLILISPFSPEAGFSPGNAMARNRYIYTLAHYALVVASDYKKGGTWAGAMENLKNHWVPLYVRPSGGAGCGALLKLGAIEFAFAEAHYEGIGDYLVRHSRSDVSASEKSEAIDLFESPARSPESNAVSGVTDEVLPTPELATASVPGDAAQTDNSRTEHSHDLYRAFTVALVSALHRCSLTAKEVQQQLGIEAGQSSVWLKRAERDEIVVKRGRPATYALVPRRLI